jgi:hypothetical protein
MASSIGPVIDALIALCQTACPTAQVVDGFPLTDEGGLFIGVGGMVEPPAEGESVPNQIGDYQLREEYEIGVLINYTTGDTDQKMMRDTVITAYDAIVDAWRAQMLSGTGIALACELSWPGAFSITQTNRDSMADGRPWFAELLFHLHVVHHNS